MPTIPPPSLELFNTLGRKKEVFTPLHPKEVTLYTCGPTVYNFAHIGNLRTYVFEDILKRVLTYDGYHVNHVMNITDVGHLVSDADEGEDKMEKGAAREGKSAWEIAEFYTQAFQKDLTDLNIVSPAKWCKATDHIAEQITLIQKLESKGFTYRTRDGIYFDTEKLPDYGKLAGLDIKHLQAGARVEIGEKKNPTDFALWKFSEHAGKRQMEWGSPWGIGFPGWHIECSAMATKYLGQPFDIHCGGIDHIPVHHTNEIAQSEAAEGTPLANYWLHGEFLLINSDKMAKSGENFITLQTIKDRGINPLAYRYFLLQAHYRKQLTFSWDALEAAETGLQRLYRSAALLTESLPIDHHNQTTEQAFLEKINNDLDLPGALALVHQKISERNKDPFVISYETLLKFDTVLGLKIKEAVESTATETRYDEEITTLIKRRDQVRIDKNWSESDRLRKQIEDLGYEVEDTKDGTKIKKL